MERWVLDDWSVGLPHHSIIRLLTLVVFGQFQKLFNPFAELAPVGQRFIMTAGQLA